MKKLKLNLSININPKDIYSKKESKLVIPCGNEETIIFKIYKNKKKKVVYITEDNGYETTLSIKSKKDRNRVENWIKNIILDYGSNLAKISFKNKKTASTLTVYIPKKKILKKLKKDVVVFFFDNSSYEVQTYILYPKEEGAYTAVEDGRECIVDTTKELFTWIKDSISELSNVKIKFKD